MSYHEGASNKTWVLQEQPVLLITEPSLQPLIFMFNLFWVFCFCFCFFDIGFLCIVLAVLELTL